MEDLNIRITQHHTAIIAVALKKLQHKIKENPHTMTYLI
ncbi:hypothetical protein MNV_1800008 [Candidatus Methanoperedens nitroreducens]|uniref:Uncharacterized protein n=1 Tax=Candidatus Methanoperedens nitratireducens TaxID=1392998 RepID=A0A284VMD8_9EURY|nr:hypothetical protein MNV_1800008 [Candidatus Methanoperedens nitroreducens]